MNSFAPPIIIGKGGGVAGAEVVAADSAESEGSRFGGGESSRFGKGRRSFSDRTAVSWRIVKTDAGETRQEAVSKPAEEYKTDRKSGTNSTRDALKRQNKAATTIPRERKRDSRHKRMQCATSLRKCTTGAIRERTGAMRERTAAITQTHHNNMPTEDTHNQEKALVLRKQ